MILKLIYSKIIHQIIKAFLLIALIIYSDFFVFAQDSLVANNKKKILKLNIKREIGPAIWRQTLQAFEKAESEVE